MNRTFEHTFPLMIIFLLVHLNLSSSQVIAVWNNTACGINQTYDYKIPITQDCVLQRASEHPSKYNFSQDSVINHREAYFNWCSAPIVTKPMKTEIKSYPLQVVDDSDNTTLDLFNPSKFNMLDPFFILLGFGTASYHGAIHAHENIFSDAAAMHYINLQVGYKLGSSKVSGKKLMLRLFGAFGYSNPTAVIKTELQQGFISEKSFRVDSGTFWEIEGGVVLYDVFRASIGRGSQELSVPSFDVIHVSHFSYWISTIGVLQHVANIEVGVLGSLMFGELYKRTSARFAFCFGFYF